MQPKESYGEIPHKGRRKSMEKIFKSKKTSSDTIPSLEYVPSLSKSGSSDFTRTELSDLFDPAALPSCSSLDSKRSYEMGDVQSLEPETTVSSKKQSKLRILKLMSPKKMLSRKKRNPAKEDLDIFEDKEEQKPIDLLDDDYTSYKISNSSDSSSFAFAAMEDPKPRSDRQLSSIQNMSINSYTSNSTRPAALNEDHRQKSIDQVMHMITANTNIHRDQDYCQIAKTPIPKPTPIKYDRRGKSIDKVFSQLFSSQKNTDNENVDLSIGLRLAAKDKLDIMNGSTTNKKGR